MKIVRTIVWVLLLVALLIFSANNWNPVEVKIWEGLVLETKLPALVVIAFLIGLIPMWLVHRASRWNNERRIASLESAARASAMATAPPVTPVRSVEPLPEEPRTDLSPADETKPAP
jgi:lipopolysaccharide assembly protein A